MRFLELYDTDSEENVLVNMDKISKVEPLIEDGGLFSSDTQKKEIGSYLIFSDDTTTNINVKQTRAEILELTKGL
jgi:hypothetical protein